MRIRAVVMSGPITRSSLPVGPSSYTPAMNSAGVDSAEPSSLLARTPRKPLVSEKTLSLPRLREVSYPWCSSDHPSALAIVTMPAAGGSECVLVA